MKKIAIVVQRYGLEVNGGAELHARLLAEELNKSNLVEVFTTCALDYDLWEDYYKEGIDLINEVKVHRFNSAKKDFSKFITLRNYVQKIKNYFDKKRTLFNFIYLEVKSLRYRFFNFNKWLEVQGPFSRDLINHIKKEKKNHDVFIFFTYLYYPTNIGINFVKEKSILIPTAHDEEVFYFSCYQKLFSKPKVILYNTTSEKELVEKTYPITKTKKNEILGIGIKYPNITDKIRPLKDNYFVYVGRISDGKNCQEMILSFLRYIEENPNNNLKLVLIGKNELRDNYKSTHLVFTGFIPEEEKNNYIVHSEALIIPSKFESLSLVTLEAMCLGKPIIGNQNCEVIKNHIEKSSCGFLYNNYDEFSDSIHKILKLTLSEKDNLAQNGKKYVDDNYNWDKINAKLTKVISLF